MDDLKGKNILDMGSGTGIISIAAYSRGAACTASDINPMAVKSANENFRLNNVHSTTLESDLFDNIDDSHKFDIIFFNPPYYNYEPRNDFEKAFGGGKDFRVIREFYKRAKDYLSSDGFVCMIISSDVEIDKIYTIIEEKGYNYKILHKIEKFFETFYIIKAFLNVT